MYIITWNEANHLHIPKVIANNEFKKHKAMTCSLDAALALFGSLTKDIRTIEAKIRDDAGNLVAGGFFTQA